MIKILLAAIAKCKKTNAKSINFDCTHDKKLPKAWRAYIVPDYFRRSVPQNAMQFEAFSITQRLENEKLLNTWRMHDLQQTLLNK